MPNNYFGGGNMRRQSGYGMGQTFGNYGGNRANTNGYAANGNPGGIYNTQQSNLGRYRPPTIARNNNGQPEWNDNGGYAYNIPNQYGNVGNYYDVPQQPRGFYPDQQGGYQGFGQGNSQPRTPYQSKPFYQEQEQYNQQRQPPQGGSSIMSSYFGQGPQQGAPDQEMVYAGGSPGFDMRGGQDFSGQFGYAQPLDAGGRRPPMFSNQSRRGVLPSRQMYF